MACRIVLSKYIGIRLPRTSQTETYGWKWSPIVKHGILFIPFVDRGMQVNASHRNPRSRTRLHPSRNLVKAGVECGFDNWTGGARTA